MLISTDIKSWLLHIETVRQLIKTLGPGHINAVRREVTKQMANNHRIYTGYTRGLPEAVEAWNNLMFDLLVLCVDHHLNKKNIFGLVPNNLDPILASHANGSKFPPLATENLTGAFKVLMLGSNEYEDYELPDDVITKEEAIQIIKDSKNTDKNLMKKFSLLNSNP